MTDPKARKVILVEHPLLPLYIKDLVARILFDNQVCHFHGVFPSCILKYSGTLCLICFKSSVVITSGWKNNWSGRGFRPS